MARPPRIEYDGALYHVSSRVEPGIKLFHDDEDRETLLEVLGQTGERYGWKVHAWVLLDDHYRLLVETPKPNLSRGMRQVNGVYTQRYNQRHHHDGAVFHGRFKAIVVERDEYLLPLACDIASAPVREGLAKRAQDWKWSSFLSTSGKAPVPEWLTIKDVLSSITKWRMRAFAAYRKKVGQAARSPSPLKNVRNQIFLGSDGFVVDLKQRFFEKSGADDQPRRIMPMDYYKNAIDDRNEAVVAIYLTGNYSMAAIGEEFGIHYSTVSRIVKKYEQAKRRYR